MSRDPVRRIDDIVVCCEKICRVMLRLNFKDLTSQALALSHIEIIGMARKQLPDDILWAVLHRNLAAGGELV